MDTVMKWQPTQEKEAERQLIKDFAEKRGYEVIKLQGDEDDGKTDGVIGRDGKQISVEARRKGYPNHKGKDCTFMSGWETEFLVREGIFLNERTIRNYESKKFLFIVDIKGPKGSEPRACRIDQTRVAELLKQPHKKMKSTNSHVWQSVKYVPVSWFIPY